MGKEVMPSLGKRSVKLLSANGTMEMGVRMLQCVYKSKASVRTGKEVMPSSGERKARPAHQLQMPP
eukprot:1144464-Pelagomonas_calceolata.AAC.2